MLDLRARRKKSLLAPIAAVVTIAGLHAGGIYLLTQQRAPKDDDSVPVVVMPPLFVAEAPAPLLKGGGAAKSHTKVQAATPEPEPVDTPEMVQPEDVPDTTPTPVDVAMADTSTSAGTDSDAPPGPGDPDGDPNGSIYGRKGGLGSCIGEGCDDDGIVNLNQRKIQPVPLHTPAPRYPSLAQRSGIEGRVKIEIIVDTRGHVKSARVVESQPPFDKAALAAVRKWTFKPLKIDGQEVSWKYQLTVRFELQ